MHFLVIIEAMRSTKVNDFDGSLVFEVHKNILGFQVTMADILIVAVADCLEKLLDDDSSLSFCELFPLSDLVK